MGWRQQTITAGLVIVSGTGSNTGLFVYSGVPSASNPPILWITNASKDPYGNLVRPPFGVSSASGETDISGGNISLWPAAGPTGLVPASITSPAYGEMQLTSGTAGAGDVQAILNLLSKTAGSGTALAWLQGAYLVATNPSTGTTPETWHAATLLNSWINTAGFSALQYRLTASPPNSVEIIGVIASTSATSATFATLPAGYHPVSAQGFPVGATANVPAGGVPQMRCDTSGNLTINGGATPPSTVSYFIHGFISLDA